MVFLKKMLDIRRVRTELKAADRTIERLGRQMVIYRRCLEAIRREAHSGSWSKAMADDAIRSATKIDKEAE